MPHRIYTITAQISPLPVAPVQTMVKGPVANIPTMIAHGVQALEFRLRGGGYYGPAIEEYLKQLTAFPAFHYVVVTNPDGTLFALLDAHKLGQALAQSMVGISWSQFATILNQGDVAAFDRLKVASGLVPRSEAIGKSTDKREALARMEKLAAEWLPVTDDRGTFVGVVERSRLTANLILDVASQLQQPE